MANYCSNCGAYIPDGKTICPSCGLNMAEPPKAPSISLDEVYAKPQEKKTTSTSERKGETPTAKIPIAEGSKVSRSRLFAMLSYVSILCFAPFLLCPNDEFAKYHGKQGILLLVISAVIDLIGKISNSSLVLLLLSLFRIYLLVMGILNAYRGKKVPLPYVGQYAEKF